MKRMTLPSTLIAILSLTHIAHAQTPVLATAELPAGFAPVANAPLGSAGASAFSATRLGGFKIIQNTEQGAYIGANNYWYNYNGQTGTSAFTATAHLVGSQDYSQMTTSNILNADTWEGSCNASVDLRTYTYQSRLAPRSLITDYLSANYTQIYNVCLPAGGYLSFQGTPNTLGASAYQYALYSCPSSSSFPDAVLFDTPLQNGSANTPLAINLAAGNYQFVVSGSFQTNARAGTGVGIQDASLSYVINVEPNAGP